MDLSDLTSVSKACDELLCEKELRLDYLILNAGVMGNPTVRESEKKSIDQIESIVAVNHVAVFFAHKRVPLLEATAKGSPLPNIQPMITFVSSDLHNIYSPTGAARKAGLLLEDGVVRCCSQQGVHGVDGTAARDSPDYALSFDPAWSYKFSKLLHVLTSKAISDKLSQRESLVQCNSMEPGYIPESDLSRSAKEKLEGFLSRVLLFLLYHGLSNWLVSYILGQPVRTLEEGAHSEVFAATHGRGGKYYRLDEEDLPSPLVDEKNLVEGFHSATSDFLQEKGFGIQIILVDAE
ncbi:short chain dehydrogenase [Nitzschia inconspicua]|uniref:Short chain dehydrogenase n=1 Tax=Nitzschia inconspicua TaxID=303405 RepID=A0A9K3LM51_9STRA|nr:short chain dehydrogenase [Nitzschia inconspicua]